LDRPTRDAYRHTAAVEYFNEVVLESGAGVSATPVDLTDHDLGVSDRRHRNERDDHEQQTTSGGQKRRHRQSSAHSPIKVSAAAGEYETKRRDYHGNKNEVMKKQQRIEQGAYPREYRIRGDGERVECPYSA